MSESNLSLFFFSGHFYAYLYAKTQDEQFYRATSTEKLFTKLCVRKCCLPLASRLRWLYVHPRDWVAYARANNSSASTVLWIHELSITFSSVLWFDAESKQIYSQRLYGSPKANKHRQRKREYGGQPEWHRIFSKPPFFKHCVRGSRWKKSSETPCGVRNFRRRCRLVR